MIVTMAMMLQGLSREFNCLTGPAYDADALISRATAWTADCPAGDSGNAVVLECAGDKHVPDIIPRRFIAIGADISENADCAIVVKGDVGTGEVLGLARRTISRFEEWGDGLVDLCFHSAGLEELVDYAYLYFGNPITIVDQGYHTLACTKNDAMSDILWTDELPAEDESDILGSVLPDSEGQGFAKYLLDLKENGRLHDYKTSTGVRMCSQVAWSKEGSLVAVNVIEKNRPLSASDCQCLDFFSKVVAAKLKVIDYTWRDVYGGYDALLQDVVRGNLSDKREFKARLTEMWIGVKPLFTVVTVTSVSGMLKYEQLCRIEDDLTSAISNARGIVDSRSLVLFINHNEPIEEDTWSSIEEYAHANHLMVGISETKGDECSLSDLLLESKLSLCIAKKLGFGRTMVRYSECRRFYLYEICSKRGDWQRYLHPCIEVLEEFDRLNGSSLLSTLVTLVSAHGNRSESAKLLGIQRSTLQYRLSRINEVCGFDLSDRDVFDDVAFSVNLMGYCGEICSPEDLASGL